VEGKCQISRCLSSPLHPFGCWVLFPFSPPLFRNNVFSFSFTFRYVLHFPVANFPRVGFGFFSDVVFLPGLPFSLRAWSPLSFIFHGPVPLNVQLLGFAIDRRLLMIPHVLLSCLKIFLVNPQHPLEPHVSLRSNPADFLPHEDVFFLLPP